MKKLSCIIILLFAICFLFGCNSKSASIEGNSDPEPFNLEEQQIQNFLDVELESSYDNIVAKMEKDSYSLNSEEISCLVQDNNVGKAFYLYEIPFIEQKIDDNWVRLYYNPKQLDVAQWTLCAVEGNTTEPNSTRYIVRLEDITPKVTPGEYRLVVFTAQKTLYAPFTLTK